VPTMKNQGVTELTVTPFLLIATILLLII